ncbi:SPOR domain-containing protein [Rhodocyclaceae bacterium SMB388]
MADNDNLELKKRSRRRLVGAAALALVAALILPMVMDDEPGLPVQDIQVTIPDREADSLLARPIGGRPTPVDDIEVAPAPVEQPPLDGGAVAPDAREDAAASEATDPRVADRDAPATLEAPSVRPVAPVPAPAPPATRAPAQPAASADEEAARVRAILEGRVAAGVSQSFFVQVGAFSEASKAVSLSDDLKGRGFSAFTESAGAVTRVRLGPFPSRSEAQRAVERLSALGIDGVVTAR